MNKIKELLSLKRVSLLYLMLPILTIFYLKITQNDNQILVITKCVILFIVVLIFDYCYLGISQKLEKKSIFIIYLLQGLLFLFFYYSYVLDLFVFINEHTIQIRKLRAKYILPEVLLLLIFIQYLFRNNIKSMSYVINVFYCILSIVIVINNSIKIDNVGFKNHFISLNQQTKVKPTILIITDEYASPLELNKVFKNNSIFDFEKKLKTVNWKIKEYSYSYDTLTINSMASIFNYNYKVSDSKMYVESSKENLKSSLLFDSLQKKNVKFYNYGIFDIGKTKAMSKIYYYENKLSGNRFINTFLSYTILNSFLNNNNITSTKQLIHNKKNIENTISELKYIPDNRSFIYIHLLLPHGPYEYHGKMNFDLDYSSNSELTKYYNYWNFSNQLLEPLLNSLTKENKYKIILTGDHGFRGDKRINPHYTFTAFYGFDESSIDSIKSVQDLGSLINSGF